jgi:hypothetical protein
VTDKPLPANWTVEKLAALTPRKRFELLENVKHTRIGTEDDRDRLVEAILESGSILDQTAMTSDNPMLYRMYEIINSIAGREACIAATQNGLPALAGVEPEIVKQLGDEYRSTYLATVEAGGFVGRMMRDLNYERIGQKAMPNGSVAKTAALWRKHR